MIFKRITKDTRCDTRWLTMKSPSIMNRLSTKSSNSSMSMVSIRRRTKRLNSKPRKSKNSRKRLRKKMIKSKTTSMTLRSFTQSSNKTKAKNRNFKKNMSLLSLKEIFLELSLFEEVLKLTFCMKRSKSINPHWGKERISTKRD